MLDWEVTDGIAVITIDHPPVNAIDLEMLEAFPRVMQEVHDAAPRAAILTGTGAVFSAGADLIRVLEADAEYVGEAVRYMARAFRSVFTFPRPLIGAINGHAIAGGAVIACACDHRVAADGDARIGLSELRVGVPFPADALEIVRHATGHHFEEVVLFGRNYKVEDARARGLIDEIVPAEELMAVSLKRAEHLARIPEPVYRLNKEAMRAPVVERIEAYRERNDAEAALLWGSDEVRASIKAFLDSL